MKNLKKPKTNFKKKVYKYWREDKYLWEQKNITFWIIPYYEYSIWEKGKTIRFKRLFKFSNPKYLKAAIKTNIYIGRKEFEENYKGNKYLVPSNYILDLTRA